MPTSMAAAVSNRTRGQTHIVENLNVWPSTSDGNISQKEKCKKCDPARIRTWNPLIRSQMPYPLGHRALLGTCGIETDAAVFSPQNNLNTRDFADLSAPLLYDMFKARTEYPLHLAIQHLREDVVFLFLIEYNSQVGLSVSLDS